MHKSEKLFIFIKDLNLKQFAIYGPLDIDHLNDWTNEKILPLNPGNKIHIIDVSSNYLEANIQSAENRGFARNSPAALVILPKDRSSEYKGNLPAYAQKADRNKVVKFLCKNRCRKQVWGEMQVDYPGREVLSRSSVGDFEAKCLICGGISIAGYNFTR